jgi:hypothetical protein
MEVAYAVPQTSHRFDLAMISKSAFFLDRVSSPRRLKMYRAIIILIAASAFYSAGINPTDFLCASKPACAARLAEGRKRLLKVNWKPIVVFPKEAAKFKTATP